MTIVEGGSKPRGKKNLVYGVLAAHNHFTISSLYCFVIAPLYHVLCHHITISMFRHNNHSLCHHYTMTPLHHYNITPWYHITISIFHHFEIQPLQHCMIALIVWKRYQRLNISRIIYLRFLQVSLNVLENGIESLHISMSPATNTRDISMIC